MKYAQLLLFTLFSLFAFKKPQTKSQRPNIIFILTDDQRWDALGYAGNNYISTPEMDKLARQGAYFKNSIVTTPICAASRATILSGMQERAHRYDFQVKEMSENYLREAYPVLLKNAGYHTGFFGKFGVKYAGKAALFDVIDDYDRNNLYSDRRGYYYKTIGQDTVHLTRYTGHQALKFLDEASTDKPFCLSLSFSAPHAHDSAKDQYFWQAETDGLLQSQIMPATELTADEYFSILPEAVKEGFNRLRWTWRYDSPEKYQHSVKGYYRMISGIDLEIAKIREKLAEKGMDKNTVIILMGDNGYFMGERQLAGKWLLYDNSIRVPLIVYDPRQGNHVDIQDISTNVDIPATILDYAGVPSPKNYQGKSLVPLISGKTKTMNRDTVLIEHLWEFDNIPPSEGVKTLGWKYFRYINDKTIEELYDLKNDQNETENLAKDPKFAKKLQEFRNATEKLITEKADPFAETPLGLDSNVKDEYVTFSWRLPANAQQTAYQIIVASDQTKLNNNIGDMWNSGEVVGPENQHVSYSGNTLNINEVYFWKVRTWDKNHRLSDYSKATTFISK